LSFNPINAQVVITEDYNKLKVSGEMKSLTIKGQEGTETVLHMKTESGKTPQWTKNKKGNKLHIEFRDPGMDIEINLPSTNSIEVNPTEIVYEGLFDVDQDQRLLVIEDMKGTIDVTTDGFEVRLKRNKNDMSIVSYYDITDDSIIIRDGGSVLMDSYWGNVPLQAMPPLDAAISMRAKLGDVHLDPLIELSEELIKLEDKITVITGEGIADIMLHSERGGQVLMELEDLEVEIEDLEKHMEEIEMHVEQLEDFEIEEGKAYAVEQNVPNPWRKKTTIKFYMPKDDVVHFSLAGIDGKTVYQKKINGKRGENIIELDRKDIKEKGVLYYSLESGPFKSTMKMILLK